MKAIIIAAGQGSRLNKHHNNEFPKSLTQLGDQAIIEIIIKNLREAGIKEIGIVCGFKKEKLQSYLGDGTRHGIPIFYIFNKKWQQPNGISVWCAKDYIAPFEPFLLLMSDHVFDKKIAERMIKAPMCEGQLLLAIDTNWQDVFDINDATKVYYKENGVRKPIIAIGKDLKEFNAIDCGMFKCDHSLFSALEKSFEKGNYTLSDGCREMIAQNAFFGIDIEGAFWIDIDTPASLEFAQKNLTKILN